MLAGWYSDDEPKSPWRVNLYVDDRASMAQQQAMEEIFLDRAGGTALRNFAVAIGQVHAVRPALITLNHASGRQSIKAGSFVTVRAAAPTPSDSFAAEFSYRSDR